MKLQICDLCKQFDGVPVLDHVSMELEKRAYLLSHGTIREREDHTVSHSDGAGNGRQRPALYGAGTDRSGFSGGPPV